MDVEESGKQVLVLLSFLLTCFAPPREKNILVMFLLVLLSIW